MNFKRTEFENVEQHLLDSLANDWALLAAGDENKWNCMTVSWGAFGQLWGKRVAFIFVRPQRYTKEFLDSTDRFTLNFFDPSFKLKLSKCGTLSGRDCDKAAECGFTPLAENGTVGIEQAKTVMVMRKLALMPQFNAGEFFDESIEQWYKNKDYHYTYIGEIEEILVK